MKRIFLACFSLIIILPVFAEENLVEPLPFGSLEEFYQAVQKFSQEELGMPLNFEIPSETTLADCRKVYILMVCHKLRFWSEQTPLCSLYVYDKTVPIPDSIILRYNLGEYDIWSEIFDAYSTTLGEKQIVPVLDLNDLEGFVLKLSTIFHEGFHYYAQRKGAVGDTTRIETIRNRKLEESAAEFIGWQAAYLFINKYCPNNHLVKKILKKLLAEQADFGYTFDKWYKELDAVYRSNSDSLKWEARLKVPINNAKLSYTIFYYYYQPMFKKIWQKTNDPKKSIEKILKILANDTKSLKKIEQGKFCPIFIDKNLVCCYDLISPFKGGK